MSTLAARETPKASRLRTGARRAALVLVPVVGTVALGSGAAFASAPPTDLTNGAGDTFFTSITSYFTGHVLVSALTLFALTVGVGMLWKWGRKAAKSG